MRILVALPLRGSGKSRLNSLYVVNVQHKQSRPAIAAMMRNRAAEFRVVFGCMPKGCNAVE